MRHEMRSYLRDAPKLRCSVIEKALKRLWRRLWCKHTHTFTFHLDGARRIYGDPTGSRHCKTSGLLLRGCYICGHVEVTDYRA